MERKERKERKRIGSANTMSITGPIVVCYVMLIGLALPISYSIIIQCYANKVYRNEFLPVTHFSL